MGHIKILNNTGSTIEVQRPTRDGVTGFIKEIKNNNQRDIPLTLNALAGYRSEDLIVYVRKKAMKPDLEKIRDLIIDKDDKED